MPWVCGKRARHTIHQSHKGNTFMISLHQMFVLCISRLSSPSLIYENHCRKQVDQTKNFQVFSHFYNLRKTRDYYKSLYIFFDNENIPNFLILKFKWIWIFCQDALNINKFWIGFFICQKCDMSAPYYKINSLKFKVFQLHNIFSLKFSFRFWGLCPTNKKNCYESDIGLYMPTKRNFKWHWVITLYQFKTCISVTETLSNTLLPKRYHFIVPVLITGLSSRD